MILFLERLLIAFVKLTLSNCTRKWKGKKEERQRDDEREERQEWESARKKVKVVFSDSGPAPLERKPLKMVGLCLAPPVTPEYLGRGKEAPAGTSIMSSGVLPGGPSVPSWLGTMSNVEKVAEPQCAHTPACPGSGALPQKW